MQFPIDIVHHILSYSDTMKLRNGKYMNQISKDDRRYIMLKNMRPKYFFKSQNGHLVLEGKKMS